MAYTSTIFIASFLIFFAEPLSGKYLLPQFGGTSAVWSVSLLFFMISIFFGYVYALTLTKFSPKVQVSVHAGLIVLALVILIFNILESSSIVFITNGSLNNYNSPYLTVISSLVVSIGLPFFLLSATSSLLQYWHGLIYRGIPYRFYALSNLASFLALVSYPLLIEPVFSLSIQSFIWFFGFLVYASLFAFTAWKYLLAFSATPIVAAPLESAQPVAEAPNLNSKALWIFFAALPSFMLVATTSQITHGIAPVPLLWVAPLSLYLASFVFAFREKNISEWCTVLLTVFSIFSLISIVVSAGSGVLEIVLYCLNLFLAGLIFHKKLYQSRPGNAFLPNFYLYLSLGGVLGGFSGSILSPLIFNNYYEFQLSVCLTLFVSLYLSSSFIKSLFENQSLIKAFIVFSWGYAILLAVLCFWSDAKEVVVYQGRSFYNVVQVKDEQDISKKLTERSIINGRIVHGLEIMHGPEPITPTTYYSYESGVGKAMLEMQKKGSPLRVGVIGLGAGTLSAYCRPGDSFVFYEIDELVYQVAQKYFTFLKHCSGAEVRLGDARILLEKEKKMEEPNTFDILIVDAFSDDSIPSHLITKEALEIYTYHLNENGIIAFHTSNRYLLLAPLVHTLFLEEDWRPLTINRFEATSTGETASEWVVASRNLKFFKNWRESQGVSLTSSYSTYPRAWTDDWSNILSVIKWKF